MRRFEGKSWINFIRNGALAGVEVPTAMFTSVMDNLLSNLSSKRQREPALNVTVTLQVNGGSATITVSDNGSAIEHTIQTQLLRGPVPSEDGLGIGLYQAAKQAESVGYRMSLSENRDGEVCFRLSPASSA